MNTTVEAIYEHGIFKPISNVPATLKEYDRVTITIKTPGEDLETEFAEWERASDQDLSAFEQKLEEMG